jgi:serine/threonine protein kinase
VSKTYASSCALKQGTGSFGRVRFATHKQTTAIHAIKILKKTAVIRLQQVRCRRLTYTSLRASRRTARSALNAHYHPLVNQVKHILDEKEILEKVNHPFVVNLVYSFQGE